MKDSVENYLDSLQSFLEDRYGDDICSDFFLSEHPGGGVTANILIGTNFETDHVKQVNILLVPKFDVEETSLEDPFDAARSVLGE